MDKDFVYAEPSCRGCEHFIDNTNRATAVYKFRGRALYSMEQYCTYGKIIQMPKSWTSLLYPRCPRHLRYPHIHIFVRGPRQGYWSDEYPGSVFLGSEAARYIYRSTSSADRKEKPFIKALFRGREDIAYMLGGFYPSCYDMIQLDNGLTQHFLMFMPGSVWQQVYPKQEALQLGYVGQYRVVAHDNQYLERYSPDNIPADCHGYMRGHFGAGKLRSNWVELTGMPAKASNELDDLLLLLQGEDGFLQDFSTLRSYCHQRDWALLHNETMKYGFLCETEHCMYHFALDLQESSSYNVYIFCFPVYRPESTKRR